MSKRISVLAVEDEVHIRTVLEYNLRLDGFEVYLAEDGAAGLELACERMPDVILLDWMMPEMDGLEVLTKLKSAEETEHIPVFILTVKSMTGDIEQAFDAGADGYITKPFDPMQLGKIIRKNLERCAKAKSG